MGSTQTAFTTGDDFISFDRSPSPPRHAQLQSNGTNTPSAAGPSTSTSRYPSPAPSNGKGKSRAIDQNVDSKLLAAKNGSARAAESSTTINNKKNKKRKGGVPEDDAKGKSKRKKDDGKGNEEYDDDDGIEYRNLKEERMAKERQAPWADLVDWRKCSDPAEMLNDEIIAFYDYMSPSRKEYETRSYIIQLITRAVQKVWPDAEVTPFGSWQTQLYLPRGDIDLVVTTKRYSDSQKNRMLAELARAMRQAYITDVVAIISKAKVPIIKFVTSEGKLNVDISINQTNGVSAGNIINQYLDVLPGSRQLVLVVKAFLSQRSMNEVYTGGLGSYSVICMVISFLQVHPKLRNSELDPHQNLGTLLLEFFELYGRNFNYDEVGITIRRGGGYFSKRRRGWIWNNQNFLLSIEDPQDRDNDISKSSFGIRQVKATLAGAYEVLQRGLFERAEWLSGRRSGRYGSGEYDGEKLSILAGVMGVTKETLKHRKEIKALYEDGRLQRQLGIPITREPSPVKGSKPERHDRHPSSHTASNSHTNSRLPSASPSASPEKNGFQAILVDDSEVEASDEEYKLDSEDEEEEDYDWSGIISDPEDGEIEEVFSIERERSFGNGNKTKPMSNTNTNTRGRYMSVSEDPEMIPDTNEDQIDPDIEESRYKVQPKISKTSKPRKDRDSSPETLSDSSIEILEPPARAPKGAGAREKGTDNGKRVGRDTRKAFWASKAAPPDGGDDGFDGEAEFVGLE